MQAHEQLNRFFGKFFHEMRKAAPSTLGKFLARAEDEFCRQGYREEISSGVENILIVRLDVIGDMILTSGFIREVRKNFPQARITLVCSPLVHPIVELCPYVDEVLAFKAKTLDRNFSRMMETIALFCKKNFWQKHFSIAFAPQWGSDNVPGLMMCWLSGARERIGFGNYPYESWLGKLQSHETALDNFLLTKNIVTPRSVVSEVEKSFYLLEAVGLKVNQTHTEIWFGEADFQRARELLKNIPSTNKKVLLGLGAGFPSRKYPVKKFLVALKELVKKNLTFVIVGGKSELEDANFVEKNLPSGKVLNLVGQTTLCETEAVISQMDFYLGNDSGVMHMAAAAQVPVLTIYREAADKENFLPGAFSECQRFPPWQTKSVILRPEHQLEECARRPPIYGWCHVGDRPHCIAQVSPQEIIDGFEKLEAL
ncbi:MAG: glycosyltransferase family 9 protein [Selenomonadaceae bacterium]|nr:glycosyltransferase family 9 protein [Selenomonadaceae bacterium]